MRLAKYLAHSGVASRRAAEDLIRAGRVTVNGDVVTDPARDVADPDRVTADGEHVRIAAERIVYAVHKPPGVISTVTDPQGRPTVVDLVPAGRRLYPVGRLDADAGGLILLTDDGELANLLTHPRHEVPKTYRVEVKGGRLGERELQALRDGVRLDDGRTAPAKVRRLGGGAIELTIREGRNHQVKRMVEAVGLRVARLDRVRFGPLALGDLKAGAHRRLGAVEVRSLREAAKPVPSAPS